MILRSHAKLNLYLEVLNKRPDNYHNIKTLFERIDLYDKVILTPRAKDKKIRIFSNLKSLPRDKRNLAYRAAKLLQKSFQINKGVDIKIIKHIPIGAGLGGGSSNAASVLLGLNKLWKLNLSQKKLIEYSRKIGADVAFFIYNCRFAIGRERGDKIKPLIDLNRRRLWHVLVVPKIKVSTLFIYRKWDRVLRNFKLTMPKYNVNILILAIRKNNPPLIGEALFNHLECITQRIYSPIKQIKERLVSFGVKSILMSGSGPAVFGIVSSRKEAEALCRQLKKQNLTWQVFITGTT